MRFYKFTTFDIADNPKQTYIDLNSIVAFTSLDPEHNKASTSIMISSNLYFLVKESTDEIKSIIGKYYFINEINNV